MRSVNILMTADISDHLEKDEPASRSAAVRGVAAVLIGAYNKGNEWIVKEIKDRVDATSPRARREDEKRGVVWEKAIVWVPENMYREIDRLGAPNNIKVSEFLRGAVIFAHDSAKNETD